jgi:FAD:protein FMN transferase
MGIDLTLPTRRQALAALAGVVLLPTQAAAEVALRHERHFLFGSPVDVMLRHAPDAPVDVSLARVMRGLQHLHGQWNAWKPGELGRVNQALREGRRVRATPALQAMIRSAAQLEQASAGFFNPAIGGAVQAWGFHDDVMRSGTKPAAAALAAWRDAAPSLAQIEWHGEWLASRNPRLQLDFGAYAKGVAIDRALDEFAARGQGEALVNLGGNLGAMGPAAWQIGIRDPFGEGLVASLATQGREAVVTSGSYERFRVLDGERCTHILDPFSAAPARGLVSVTVLHGSAALADAAATALLVAGPQRWREVAQRLGVTQVLVIGPDGRGTASAALAPRLRFASRDWHRRISMA